MEELMADSRWGLAVPPAIGYRLSPATYGVYQIGLVYARSCVIIGTSGAIVIP